MGLATQILLQISADYIKPAGRGQKLYSLLDRTTKTLNDGTGAGNADLVYQSAEGGDELAPSALVGLDLNNTLLDALGDPFPAAKIKVMKLYAYATNAADLKVGAAALHPFSGWWGSASMYDLVPPDGSLVRVHPGTGWTVTPNVTDILQILNLSSTDPGRYDITLIGASA